MSIDDLKIAELIQASIYSFDPDTWDVHTPRVMPITICVEAGSQSQKLGEIIAHEAVGLLKEYGYSTTYQWGPFEGSYFTTIFGTGDQLENGDTLQKNEAAISEELARRVAGIDWRRIGEVAGQSMKVAAAVGTIVAVFVPGPNALVIGSFVVSAKVLGLMKAGGAVVTIVEGAKKIFLDNDKASKATDSNQGEAISYPPPPGRINLMPPIRLKARHA